MEKSSGTLYWYGAGSDVLEETTLSGTATNDYIFFGGERVVRRDASGNIFPYFADHLGSSRKIEEVAAGGSTASPCYDADFYPYGREHSFVDSCPQNYKFTGKERDGESGLDYFGARYYSSSLGRFMSPDWAAKAEPVPYSKLGSPQSLNLYGYVLNNPITLTDPDGHACADPKKGCTITVQFRAFIPQKTMDGFKGDSRSFTSDPNASSRLSTTATINTDSSANGGHTLVSSSTMVGSTTFLPGVMGGITKTASGPQLPQVTATQDKNGNVTLHLTENVRNPFQPAGNGITANVNITIPRGGTSATVSGTLSGSPSFELNVSSQTGPTANIPVAASSGSSIMFPIKLETQRQVKVTGLVP